MSHWVIIIAIFIFVGLVLYKNNEFYGPGLAYPQIDETNLIANPKFGRLTDVFGICSPESWPCEYNTSMALHSGGIPNIPHIE